MGGQLPRDGMEEASTDSREWPCGLAVLPFLTRNGTGGGGIETETGQPRTFTETHPGEERLPQAVEGCRNVYEAK